MTKIFIVGISGKMGANIIAAAKDRTDIEIVGGLDAFPCEGFPAFKRADEVNVPIDVIIDFSRPETLEETISVARRNTCPVVIATTGYNDKQLEKIRKLSEEVGVLHSGNMSLGVNLLTGLVKKAASILEGFDVEIVEKHHNQKVDAPSGTALMLANAAKGETDEIVVGRHGSSCKRKKNEIGISSVRGGTIVGEHDVMFIGDDEIVTISHTALSRKLFAVGALKAALYMADKKSGMFDMNDVLGL
ncbi:MAG: 4-hydroxy-tetrahydrodipicolinate reductase [Clostridia bacterium]|nr:4-hydroxy-tetrahydrodipicolinate reductase [Clostridia bacterium]